MLLRCQVETRPVTAGVPPGLACLTVEIGPGGTIDGPGGRQVLYMVYGKLPSRLKSMGIGK